MEKIDVLIIGAGVVGLSVAAELTEKLDQLSVAVLERHSKFGQETSSRNSEVIHSGIYYPTDSLKAKLCVEGKQLLYQFCQKWAIPHRPIGKLIIARNAEEISSLESIMIQARENGVDDLVLLEQDQVAKLEPHIRAVAAILSPSTGIVDSHELMLRLEWSSLEQGAMIAYKHEVVAIQREGEEYVVTYRNPTGQIEAIQCTWLINCAGLDSDKLLAGLGMDVDQMGYRIHPCKGEYFSVSNSLSNLVSHLIYPPPLRDLKGLGIHATKTLDGRMRFGPNAFYIEDLDYNVDPEHAQEFFETVKTYLPFLESTDLQPDMAGIRPKIQGPKDDFRDFVIQHEENRGFTGLINLIGIESPGLTSCLAIAKRVRESIIGIK